MPCICGLSTASIGCLIGTVSEPQILGGQKRSKTYYLILKTINGNDDKSLIQSQCLLLCLKEHCDDLQCIREQWIWTEEYHLSGSITLLEYPEYFQIPPSGLGLDTVEDDICQAFTLVISNLVTAQPAISILLQVREMKRVRRVSCLAYPGQITELGFKFRGCCCLQCLDCFLSIV